MFNSCTIIAMSWVNGSQMYKSYRDDKCSKQPVEDLIRASGVDLTNGWGLTVSKLSSGLQNYSVCWFEH